MVMQPDFGTMLQLHKKEPEALERLRLQLSPELVSNASGDTKRRLLGLQLRINMELRQEGNPTARFLKLSCMMLKLFTELNYCPNEPIAAIVEKIRHKKPISCHSLSIPKTSTTRASIDHKPVCKHHG